MRDYIRLAGILFFVCAIAAAALGFTNSATYDRIQEQQVIASAEAKKAVLPDAEEFENLDEAALTEIKSNTKYNYITEIYVAKAAGNVIGYAIQVAPKGYGGEVEVVVGITNDGNIQGIKVGNNSETPGLGKKAATADFQDQYVGATWESPIDVIKNATPKGNEIAAISGATITSRAVTDGVNQALEAARELSGK
ncbi:MAG: RnfABCDGE type electron transport complex subunit G [Clostridiaceae bacterium]|nr:RnfABCDGE type electron transport complex subunit G [Clostridiaceae bacterium]